MEDFPDPIKPLALRIQAAGNIPVLDQLTVNDYPPGVGLAPHIDTHSAFTGIWNTFSTTALSWIPRLYSTCQLANRELCSLSTRIRHMIECSGVIHIPMYPSIARSSLCIHTRVCFIFDEGWCSAITLNLLTPLSLRLHRIIVNGCGCNNGISQGWWSQENSPCTKIPADYGWRI